MAVTTPPTITPPPTRPDRADPATFADRADAWTIWERDKQVPEMAAIGANVYVNATDAASSASAANTSRQQAQQAVTDAQGQVTLAAGQVSLAATQAGNAAASAQQAGIAAAAAGAAAGFDFAGQSGKFAQVNPAETGLQLVNIAAPQIVRSARSSNTPIVAADRQKLIDITAGTFNQTLDASASLGSGWFAYLRNFGAGVVTIDPNGAETIDGLPTLAIYPGQVRLLQSDGVALRSLLIAGAAVFSAVDEKPSGTQGGGTVAATWTPRVLNTVRGNSVPGASLASNTVTLPAGSYLVRGSFPFMTNGSQRTRLVNVTTSATLVDGTSENGATSGTTRSVVSGFFTLSAETPVRVDYYTPVAQAVTGLGAISGIAGVPEVYSEISFTKVA